MDKLLTRRYERTGRAEHLDEVVTERAARLADAAGADRSHWRMRLASSLADRFARRGDPADLREAVQQCRAAADETTGEERGRALTRLFRIQSDAFLAGEQLTDDLSAVIAAGSAALEFLPEDDYVVPGVRTNVGYFQLRRYERTGDSTDLANALELLQKAVETLPEDDARCVTARARLAEGLVMRHKQTVRESEAHGFGGPCSATCSRRLTCLPGARTRRQPTARRGPGFSGISGRVPRRRRAPTTGPTCSMGRSMPSGRSLARRRRPQSGTARTRPGAAPAFHGAPGRSGSHRGHRAVEEGDRERGAGTYEELTAQLGLAESLAMRLILDPLNDEDRRAAMEVYRRVAHTESAGLAARVSASFAWARVAHDGGYFEEALGGYESMLTLMAEMAPIGLDDADRLRQLAEEDGRPSRAVGCAVAVGRSSAPWNCWSGAG